jgi:uncharacterized membrane protein (DUF4010 family)
MEFTDAYTLATALGLGLLIGFQREWAEEHAAGIRTFPLITLLGAVTALIAREFGPLPLVGGLIGTVLIMGLSQVLRWKDGEKGSGITTDMAALVMFSVGALLVVGQLASAILVAGAVAVLLQWKRPLHDFVRQLGEPDIRAIIRVVLIGLVILPLLPNEDYGPYAVLNPFKMWLMVALIVGISLVAYLTYKLLGARAGTLLGSFLGGLISSTATTVGYARTSRNDKALVPMASAAIMIASTIVFVRVLFEIAIVAPEVLMRTGPPLVAMMAFMGALAAISFRLTGKQDTPEKPNHKPPSDLLAAVIFGLLYGAVLLGVAFAKENFGDEGLYVVAVLSGLTDMDAITLSTAQLIKNEGLEASTGWRVILVGSIANLVFKAGAVAVLGNRHLFWRVLLLFSLSAAFGAGIFVFWP